MNQLVFRTNRQPRPARCLGGALWLSLLFAPLVGACDGGVAADDAGPQEPEATGGVAGPGPVAGDPWSDDAAHADGGSGAGDPPVADSGWVWDEERGRHVVAGEGCPESAPAPHGAAPAPEEAAQTVTFVVTNTSDEVRYVATKGSECTLFGVARVAATGDEPLLLGWSPHAELAEICGSHVDSLVPTDTPEEVTALEPGESHSLVWDARELVGVTEPAESPWWEGELRFAAPRRAPAGDYRVTLAATAEVPPNCHGSEPVRACYGSLWVSPVLHEVCELPTPSIVTVDFALPESGDVVVPISLTE